MIIRLALFILLCCITTSVNAQVALAQVAGPQPYLPYSTILPVPNSTLNYTEVAFDYPAVKGAVEYRLTIIEKETSGIVGSQTVSDNNTVFIMHGFKFGSECTWFYQALNEKGKEIYKSPEFKFSIVTFSGKRLRIVSSDNNVHSHGLISFDNLGIITDREGNPVWVLPKELRPQREDVIEDLQVTTAGTILFIRNHEIREMMPDGRNALKLNAGTTKGFHGFRHGVERLPNGNIMSISDEAVYARNGIDTSVTQSLFGVIAEYNRKSGLVWSWHSSLYFAKSDPGKKMINGKLDFPSGPIAFCNSMEGDSEYVYACLADVDRVVKISKKSKEVVHTYGSKPDSLEIWRSGSGFLAQHDVAVLRDRQIAFFNNGCSDKFPKWESTLYFTSADGYFLKGDYPLKLEGETDGKSTSGGSVDELPNGNLLVNCGSTGRVFEITRDAKVVWDAMAETDETNSGKWTTSPLNRSHYVSSLYPCYFTANISAQTKKRIEVTVWNEGSEDDGYIIEYKSSDKWTLSADIGKVEPGGNFTWVMGLNKKFQISQVRVTSKSNPDFVRLISVN